MQVLREASTATYKPIGNRKDDDKANKIMPQDERTSHYRSERNGGAASIARLVTLEAKVMAVVTENNRLRAEMNATKRTVADLKRKLTAVCDEREKENAVAATTAASRPGNALHASCPNLQNDAELLEARVHALEKIVVGGAKVRKKGQSSATTPPSPEQTSSSRSRERSTTPTPPAEEGSSRSRCSSTRRRSTTPTPDQEESTKYHSRSRSSGRRKTEQEQELQNRQEASNRSRSRTSSRKRSSTIEEEFATIMNEDMNSSIALLTSGSDDDRLMSNWNKSSSSKSKSSSKVLSSSSQHSKKKDKKNKSNKDRKREGLGSSPSNLLTDRSFSLFSTSATSSAETPKRSVGPTTKGGSDQNHTSCPSLLLSPSTPVMSNTSSHHNHKARKQPQQPIDHEQEEEDGDFDADPFTSLSPGSKHKWKTLDDNHVDAGDDHKIVSTTTRTSANDIYQPYTPGQVALAQASDHKLQQYLDFPGTCSLYPKFVMSVRSIHAPHTDSSKKDGDHDDAATAATFSSLRGGMVYLFHKRIYVPAAQRQATMEHYYYQYCHGLQEQGHQYNNYDENEVKPWAAAMCKHKIWPTIDADITNFTVQRRSSSSLRK